MRIEPASLNPPPGLEELLADLGGGENGFGGTPVHTGAETVAQYLQRCCDMPDPAKLPLSTGVSRDHRPTSELGRLHQRS